MHSKSAIFKRKWLMTNMFKHTRNTDNSGIRFSKQISMNNIAPKTAKMLDTQNYFQNHIKNAKANKFLSQSAFYTSKGSTCKVLPFYDFGLKFYDKFCSAPTRSSTSYAYLITKIGNRNLKWIRSSKNVKKCTISGQTPALTLRRVIVSLKSW